MNTQLIPKLKEKTEEYKEWWIFKPNSPLATYIQQQGYALNLYFRPIELIETIQNIAHFKNMYTYGNQDVIVLDEELQQCFNTTCIYLPKLMSFCLCHVNVVVDSKRCDQLKNEMIKNDFYIEPPVDLILNDPTSKFWIPQQFITAYNQKKKRVNYPWKELMSLFFKFITKYENGINQLGGSMFQIQPNCSFADKVQFKYFHTQQVPTILKQITKFLGKSNNLSTLCSDLYFCDVSPHDDVIFWIEDMITMNYDAFPLRSSYVYL